jgi:hypothetical protein
LLILFNGKKIVLISPRATLPTLRRRALRLPNFIQSHDFFSDMNRFFS